MEMTLYVCGDGTAYLSDSEKQTYIPLGKLKCVKLGDGAEHEVFMTVKSWQDEQ